MVLKVKNIIKLLEEDGWQLDRINGSHRHYSHETKKGIVTVLGKLSSDLAKGTEKSIFKQAGLKK
ncbi:MAG: YcfA family protein [Ignavibacteria bacterium]|nr:YcfA family protein [Ignavibacteria bacterium]